MKTSLPLCALLVVALTLWPLAADSQDGTAEKPEPGPLSKPYGATIEVQNAGLIAYGDPIFISVRITPLDDLNIESISLLPQGQLAGLYGSEVKDKNGEPTSKWPCAVGILFRPKGVPFSVSCEIRPVFGLRDYLDPRVILLPSSKHKILVRVTQVEGAEPVEHFEEVFADVMPTKASVMVGALIGALVLSIFFATYRDPSAPALTWKEFFPRLVSLPLKVIDAIRSAVLAAICALILILLADVSEGGQPPISLHVQDFWGGVIVGLFSVPLARWIATRLTTADNAPPPPNPPSPPPNPPPPPDDEP